MNALTQARDDAEALWNAGYAPFHSLGIEQDTAELFLCAFREAFRLAPRRSDGIAWAYAGGMGFGWSMRRPSLVAKSREYQRACVIAGMLGLPGPVEKDLLWIPQTALLAGVALNWSQIGLARVDDATIWATWLERIYAETAESALLIDAGSAFAGWVKWAAVMLPESLWPQVTPAATQGIERWCWAVTDPSAPSGLSGFRWQELYAQWRAMAAFV